MLGTKPLLFYSPFLFSMKENPIASMYIGDAVAWVDFHGAPLVLPLTQFDNNRPAADQSPAILKERLEELCLSFIERTNGFLPLGEISIEEYIDPKFNVRAYKAYYLGFVPVP